MCLDKNKPDNELEQALAKAEERVIKAEKAFKKFRSMRRFKNYLRARGRRDILKYELSKKSEN